MSSNITLQARHRVGLLATLALVTSGAGAFAQNDPKPGFNLFSVEQDIEIGRQSAAQAERQLPVLEDPSLERYLNTVARRLVEEAPGARYPYRIRAVDASEINAFTFPGGFLYVNRGLIEATRSESELAGVLAHEIAHVALRHGTHQASKAYAAQAGLGILGGLLGRNDSRSGQIIDAIGGIGLNAVFLKFSRNDEYEADLVGARMMKRAGYAPAAMASFFDLLNQKREREPGKLEQFFSSHPAPADRAARLRAEAERLGPVDSPREVGEYASVKDELRGRPSSQRRTARLSPGAEPEERGRNRPALPRIEAPSSRMRTFQQRDGFFEIEYPSNWRAHEARRGYGVVIAPEGGIEDDGARGQNVLYGVVINHYDPFDRSGGGTLEEATDDLVGQIRRGSPHLRARGGSERRKTVDGARGLTVVLQGRSPLTGAEERVTVLTRELTDDHVLYALLVAPREDSPELTPVFDRMVDSLRVNDRVAHR
jgi:beta-barrel assembly-enhancing protease